MWPDWAIYNYLGNFLTPLFTINFLIQFNHILAAFEKGSFLLVKNVLANFVYMGRINNLFTIIYITILLAMKYEHWHMTNPA